jgi:hypothetical protein
MIDKVRSVARSLTDEKAEQLDLLLSQDRSAQMLQDKTLGVAKVVTPDNFENLLEVMKAELITDVQTAADATVAEVRKNAEKDVRRAGEKRRSAEAENVALQHRLAASTDEDYQVIDALVMDVNRSSKRERFWFYAIAYLIIAFFALSSFTLEFVDGIIRYFILIFCGFFIFVLAAMQLFSFGIDLESNFEKRSRNRLKALAKKRGLGPKLRKFDFVWERNSKELQVASVLSQTFLTCFRGFHRAFSARGVRG